jgi:hypothetical protein
MSREPSPDAAAPPAAPAKVQAPGPFFPRAVLGLCVLATGLAGLVALALAREGGPTLLLRLFHGATGRLDSVVVRFPERPELHPGDPVYTVEGQAFALVGRVRSVAAALPFDCMLELDPALRGRRAQGLLATAMAPGNDLGWILRTLIPPQLREQVLLELAELWKEHGPSVVERLQSPTLLLLKRVADAILAQLPAALALSEEAGRTLLRDLAYGIYPEHLEPLIREQVLAAVGPRVGPLAAAAAAEIWARVSVADLAALAWASSQRSVGLIGDDERDRRLARLIEVRALPVLAERVGPILAAAGEALLDAAMAPATQEALRQAGLELVGSESFRAFSRALVDAWVVHNSALHEELRLALAESRLLDPLREFYALAEPLLERALEEILTRPDRAGMDHQLARVLRHVVLKKDARYVVLAPDPGAQGRLPIPGRIGEDP